MGVHSDQSPSHVTHRRPRPHPMSASVGGMFRYHVLDSCCQSPSARALSCFCLGFFASSSASIHPSGSIGGTRQQQKKPDACGGAPKSGPFLPVGPGSWTFLWIMIWTCHALLGGNNAAFPCSSDAERERLRIRVFSPLSLSLGFLIPQRRNMIITCF